jgi:transcriptional regulator with XRE-family HTH domain
MVKEEKQMKKQSIISQLRALRKQRGMTQKELAAKCGTQQQRIAEIESGEFSPTLETLRPILKALNAKLLLHDLSAHERGLLKFKVGDKIEIQCRKSRLLHIKKIYDGEVGTITEIWPGNPYGEYCVKLPNGCNNSFFADELKPKGEE